MRLIRKRLSDRAGASIILAMVFFLICFFVGGTVLTAATANGGRLKNMKTNRQEYLSERSAALLLQEMLPGANKKLTIVNRVVTNTTTSIVGGATNVTVTKSYNITATAPTGAKDEIQYVPYEATLWNYIENLPAVGGGTNIEGLTNFTFGSHASAVGSYAAASNTIKITANGETVEGTYDCSAGNSTPLGTFRVDFDQLSLIMRASSSETKTVAEEVRPGGVVVRTETITTTIQWDAPIIVKGGAA